SLNSAIYIVDFFSLKSPLINSVTSTNSVLLLILSKVLLSLNLNVCPVTSNVDFQNQCEVSLPTRFFTPNPTPKEEKTLLVLYISSFNFPLTNIRSEPKL